MVCQENFSQKKESLPLFILHGWQSKKERWQKVKKLLEEEGFQVIVPDLPGFKPQRELKKIWDLEDYSNWFFDFSQNFEKFFLLGHSFGGRVAIKFSRKYPQKVEKLILVAPGGILHQKTLKEKMILKFLPFLKKFSFLPGFVFLRKIFYKFFLKKTDYLKAKGYLKESFKKIVSEDLLSFLPDLKMPVFLIWGKKDKYLPFEDAYLMAKKIKKVKLKIFENLGHNFHQQAPEILVKEIKEFLK